MGKLKRVSHSKRAADQGPLHVTLRLRRGLPSLRTPRTYRVLERAFRQGKQRFGWQVVHYSVLSNHLHMIVEPQGAGGAVSRFMQGLAIRIAKALNKKWRRRGSVFADRFFSVALKTWAQFRRTVAYVLNNARKHGVPIPAGQVDRYSSAPWYGRWNAVGLHLRRPLREPPVASVAHWGLRPCLNVDDVPGIWRHKRKPL